MTTTNNNITTNIMIFTNIKTLCKDMATNYQSFIYSPTIADIEITCIFRVVELEYDRRNKCHTLHFCSSTFGGSEMIITGKVKKVEKVGGENELSEFRFYIEGRNEPIVFLACSK